MIPKLEFFFLYVCVGGGGGGVVGGGLGGWGRSLINLPKVTEESVLYIAVIHMAIAG